MKLARLWKTLLAAPAVIAILLILVCMLDVGLLLILGRSYSPAAFIFIFSIGGMLAAVFAFFYGFQLVPVKNQVSKWMLISELILIGGLLFFLFSKLEGGVYEPAFKAFGCTLALGSLLFSNFRIDNTSSRL